MKTMFPRLKARIAQNRKQFIAYTILRTLVLITAIRCLFTHNYESFAICMLSLVLFLMPSFLERMFRVEIPPVFQVIIYLFIYAAEILGEVNKYYTAIPGWDTMLHTINGFLCAAIGFSLFNILNRGSSFIKLSPFYMALVAFCFSMTVGVVWEFFEFAADQFLHMDMQKDFIVTDFASVTLDATRSQIPVQVSDITATVIQTADGSTYNIQGGYLDIGILDTMKDLMVNFVGAVVFSIIGFLYEYHHKEKSLATGLMIRPLTEEGLQAIEEDIQEKLTKKKKRSATKEKNNSEKS